MRYQDKGLLAGIKSGMMHREGQSPMTLQIYNRSLCFEAITQVGGGDDGLQSGE